MARVQDAGRGDEEGGDRSRREGAGKGKGRKERAQRTRARGTLEALKEMAARADTLGVVMDEMRRVEGAVAEADDWARRAQEQAERGIVGEGDAGVVKALLEEGRGLVAEVPLAAELERALRGWEWTVAAVPLLRRLSDAEAGGAEVALRELVECVESGTALRVGGEDLGTLKRATERAGRWESAARCVRLPRRWPGRRAAVARARGASATLPCVPDQWCMR